MLRGRLACINIFICTIECSSTLMITFIHALTFTLTPCIDKEDDPFAVPDTPPYPRSPYPRPTESGGGLSVVAVGVAAALLVSVTVILWVARKRAGGVEVGGGGDDGGGEYEPVDV